MNKNSFLGWLPKLVLGAFVFIISNGALASTAERCAASVGAVKAAENEMKDEIPRLSESERIIASELGIKALWYSPKLARVAKQFRISRPQFQREPEPVFSRVATNETILDEYFFPYLEALRRSESAEVRPKIADWLNRVKLRYDTLVTESLRMSRTAQDSVLFAEACELENLSIEAGGETRDPSKKGVQIIPVQFLEGDDKPVPISEAANWEEPSFLPEEVRDVLDKAESLLRERIRKFSGTSSGNPKALEAAAVEVIRHQMILAGLIVSNYEMAQKEPELKRLVAGSLHQSGLFDQALIDQILRMPAAPATRENIGSLAHLRTAWKITMDHILSIRETLEAE